MEKLEDFIKKMVEEKPSMTDDDLEKELREIKDPVRTRKPRWKIGYIRQEIGSYRREQQQPSNVAVDAKQVAEIHEIKKHPDIFASREEYPPVTPKEKKSVELPADSDEPPSRHGAIVELRELIDDLTDTVFTIKKNVSSDISQIKEKLASISPIPVVDEYVEMELQRKTVESIKRNCEEKNIDEESDYLNDLMAVEDVLKKETEDSIKPYKSLVSLIKDAGGEMILKLTVFDGNKVCYTKIKGKGITKRGLLVGFLIGMGVGGLIVSLVLFFTTASASIF